MKRLLSLLSSRKGSPTMEYVVIIAVGALFASLLMLVFEDQSISGLLKEKVEQAINQESNSSLHNSDDPEPIKKDPVIEYEKPQPVSVIPQNNDRPQGIKDQLSRFLFGKDSSSFTTVDAVTALSKLKGTQKILSNPGVYLLQQGDKLLTDLVLKQSPDNKTVFHVWSYEVKERDLWDMFLGLNPGKALNELESGKNRITGEKLGPVDYVLNLAGLIPEGGAIVKGGKMLLKPVKEAIVDPATSKLSKHVLDPLANKAKKHIIDPLADKFNKYIGKPVSKKVDKVREGIAEFACSRFAYSNSPTPYALIMLVSGGGNEECKEEVVDFLGGDKKQQTQKKVEKDKSLKPGTPEHKENRWEVYKANGGKMKYEHWSNRYDANMGKPSRSHKLVEEYQKSLGWGTTQYSVDTPKGLRILDIADGKALKGIEHKTTTKTDGTKGYFSRDPRIREEIEKDKYLVQVENWDITWVFENADVSKPLIEDLKRAGIKVVIK